MKASLTITRDNADDEIEIEVTGRYKPGYDSRRECGLPVSPDEPARFEDIEAVVTDDAYLEGAFAYRNGQVLALTPTEEEQANEALMDAWSRTY